MYTISVVYYEQRYFVVMCVHISADINIMFVVDDVSADSELQSATTPTATPPRTGTTSQKAGE